MTETELSQLGAFLLSLSAPVDADPEWLRPPAIEGPERAAFAPTRIGTAITSDEVVSLP